MHHLFIHSYFSSSIKKNNWFVPDALLKNILNSTYFPIGLTWVFFIINTELNLYTVYISFLLLIFEKYFPFVPVVLKLFHQLFHVELYRGCFWIANHIKLRYRLYGGVKLFQSFVFQVAENTIKLRIYRKFEEFSY